MNNCCEIQARQFVGGLLAALEDTMRDALEFRVDHGGMTVEQYDGEKMDMEATLSELRHKAEVYGLLEKKCCRCERPLLGNEPDWYEGHCRQCAEEMERTI